MLQCVKAPADCDLFPATVYGWLNRPTDGEPCDIKTVITEAITQGATDW